MVDGAHGHMDHVVRHVVEEHKGRLEDVTILHLPVVEIVVMVQVTRRLHVTPIAVLVRLCNYQCEGKLTNWYKLHPTIIVNIFASA